MNRSNEPGDDAAFPQDEAAPVIAHMNEDHVDDMVLICSELGGVAGVVSAEMVGVDRMGGDFVATSRDGGTVPVRIPWSGWLTERREIRTELVRLVQEARDAP